VEDEDPKIPHCYMRDPFGIIFNLAEEPLWRLRKNLS
jgi:hypothetical protein